ncbi:MAG: trimethylamine methyltransferase family protein, partial [Dethiobacteria bacterium]
MIKRKFKPVRSLLEFRVLSDRDIQLIHEAALEVMEETGVRFPSKLALDVLEEAGCEVNRETMVAKLPATLVMEALRKAPAQFLLAGRDPK